MREYAIVWDKLLTAHSAKLRSQYWIEAIQYVHDNVPTVGLTHSAKTASFARGNEQRLKAMNELKHCSNKKNLMVWRGDPIFFYCQNLCAFSRGWANTMSHYLFRIQHIHVAVEYGISTLSPVYVLLLLLSDPQCESLPTSAYDPDMLTKTNRIRHVSIGNLMMGHTK